MAFLDNSGDIILDAVLTEAGRKRMAEGNFSITKFALGDDEIDYSLYNKNHSSGSAYYDLEILQTPVFEAFTQINAGINYGLLPNESTDLLYLPVMKTNELSSITATGGPGAIASSGSSGLFLLADNSNDGSTVSAKIFKVINGDAGGVSLGQIDGNSPQNFVMVEAGLDTGFGNIPNGTAANRNSFLSANGLVDTALHVFYDSRFINTIYGVQTGTGFGFSNDGPSNALRSQMTPLVTGTPTTIQSGLENYSAVTVRVVNNQIYQTTSPNTEEDYSAIGGPRSIAAAIAPAIKPGLNAEYSLYGNTTDHTINGVNVSTIDTTIYVQGASTGAQVQIPIRIAKIR